MTIYLIQISLCLIIFNLAYVVFFRRDTFFARNRIYIVGSLFLTFILPFLPIPELFSIFNSGPRPTIEVGMPVPVTGFYKLMVNRIAVGNAQEGFSLFRIAGLIYLAGVLFVLIQMSFQIAKILGIMQSSDSLRYHGIKVYLCEGETSHFSFFRNIFINKAFIEEGSVEYEKVLSHEMVHIKQGHSYDLLLAEFICIIQWFNPFAWQYRKALQEVHEFLADNKVIQSGCSRAEYQAVLVNQALGIKVFSLSNNFNHIKLKKRIIMMSKMKSSNLVYWKTLIILPVIILALALSGSKASSQSSSGKDVTYTGKVTDARNNEALPGAHIIVKGTTVGTTTEEDGTYKISADENCTLVCSFVGYDTQEFKPGKSMALISMKLNNTKIEGTTITPGMNEKQEGKAIPSNAIYYVDGKEVSGEYAKSIDPNTIASMDVLKGESATKKYGDKGKNGVILIKLKKPGQPESDILAPPPPPPPPSSVTSKSGEKIFMVVEESASFQGGDLTKFMEYVKNNVKYPEIAVKNKIQGKVVLQFVVNHLGEVSEVKIIRGVAPSLDKAAIDAIKSSPKWNPGMQGGKSVAQLFTMPVEFKLK